MYVGVLFAPLQYHLFSKICICGCVFVWPYRLHPRTSLNWQAFLLCRFFKIIQKRNSIYFLYNWLAF